MGKSHRRRSAQNPASPKHQRRGSARNEPQLRALAGFGRATSAEIPAITRSRLCGHQRLADPQCAEQRRAFVSLLLLSETRCRLNFWTSPTAARETLAAAGFDQWPL